ncbi:hypothetical protein [Microbulbifer sp. HZ11]|uniref:hypothetical protein n=1 Tax=unclassified Microbulbifer TaxID=2619833 RepID=UPI0005BD5DD0|nr:hypothetical protein [Microbulbifer sp. HZ11]
MRTQGLRRLFAAGMVSLALSTSTSAQDSFWGGDDHTPSLAIAATEIQLDVPMPVSSGDMQLMLALAGNGGGLADLKKEAIRNYTQHIHSELARVLYGYLEDEEVPLVAENGLLQLQNKLNLKVIKHLSAMKPKGDHDLEQGNVTLKGEFRYILSNRSGTALREQRVSIDDMKITEKYRVRTYHDNRAGEDTTEAAIKEALTEMVEELVEAMEDNLEADELRDMAAL